MGTLRGPAIFLAYAIALPVVAAEAGRHSPPDSGLNQPIYAHNRNPFVQIFGLPHPAGGTLLRRGESALGLFLEAGNTFIEKGPPDETAFIDGETYRLDVVYRRGWAERWEVGIEVPFIRHEGGVLDSFIEGWHDLTNLPNGNREMFDQDDLLFRYRAGGEVQYELAESASGIGDLRLSLGYRINEDLAWRSTLKLPTGDAAELTGSDAADLATGLYYSKRLWPRWIFHGSAGVVLLGEGDVLRQQQRDALLYGSATLSWQALRRTSFKLQLDLHSAAYDARPKPLGGDAGQLVAGVSFALGEGAVLDFTLSEDIVVGTSPDVVFQIGMRWRNP